jgi:hypothetical protein
MKACFVNILLYIGNKSLEGFVLIMCEHAIIIFIFIFIFMWMSILTVKFDVVGM